MLFSLPVSFVKISSDVIEEIKCIIKDFSLTFYEDYNDGCLHHEINNNDFKIFLYDRLQSFLPEEVSDKERFLDSHIRYIVYDIEKEYYIDFHVDSCDKTIIIGLEKDENIFDDLLFDNIQEPKNNLWDFGMMIFEGNVYHGGTIYGSGKRVILSIHIGDNFAA